MRDRMRARMFALASASAFLPISSAATQLSEAAANVLETGRPMRVQLTDELAAVLLKQLNASSPVFADVSQVKSYRQPGCKRLRVVFSAPEVRTKGPDGKTVSFTYTHEQDLCADGDAPSVR